MARHLGLARPGRGRSKPAVIITKGLGNSGDETRSIRDRFDWAEIALLARQNGAVRFISVPTDLA
jgi:hypothetical protein